MQTLIDLLTFRTFISPYLLIGMYYAGALGIPFFVWLLLRWLRNRYTHIEQGLQTGKAIWLERTRARDRAIFYSVFALMFFGMQIAWRMMFEFLLAYLQMRDALLQLSGQL